MHKMIFEYLYKLFISLFFIAIGFNALAQSLQRPINPPERPKNTVNKPLPKYSISTMKYREYKIPAVLAWAEAKKKGYKFYPEGASGRRDGNNVWGVSYYHDANNRFREAQRGALYSSGINMQTVAIVEDVVGTALGTADFAPSYAIFHLFEGRNLKTGWTVSDINFGGNYTFEKPQSPNSRSPHTVIRLSIRGRNAKNQGFANFKEIILRGPEGRDWREAFLQN